MIGLNTLQEAMEIELSISESMVKAQTLWANMYVNKASWLVEDEVFSLNLPAAIAAEISRVVTVEMKVRIEGSLRADFISAQMKHVLNKLREHVELGSAKGGLIFKPFISGKNVAVDCVQADAFFPVKFDANGKSDEEGNIFEGYLITNRVFRTEEEGLLGVEVSLKDVEEWADIEPFGVIANVERPLFGYFRYPLANNIDTTSPLGVSCYARAVDLIQQADEHWSDLMWEFDTAKRALYVDPLALAHDENDEVYLPNKRLFQTLKGSGIEENMFEEWTPNIREQNFLNGLDAILRKIEFLCGMDYGRISNPDTVDKTAKEISASQQRFFSTVTDVQKSLQEALEELVYAIDVWTTVAGLAPQGVYNTAYEFDDSIIVDKDTQFDQDSRAVGMNVMDRIEFRMRNYKEDLATATKKIAAIPLPSTDLFGD